MVPLSVAVEFTDAAARLIVAGMPSLTVVCADLAYPRNVLGAPEGRRVNCSAWRTPALSAPEFHRIVPLYVRSAFSTAPANDAEGPVHANTVSSVAVPGPVRAPVTAELGHILGGIGKQNAMRVKSDVVGAETIGSGRVRWLKRNTVGVGFDVLPEPPNV